MKTSKFKICLMLSGVLGLGVLLWIFGSVNTELQDNTHNKISESRNRPPQPQPKVQQSKEASQPKIFNWGGALCSSEETGDGFFNRQKIRKFIEHHKTKFQKAGNTLDRWRIVQLKSRAFIPNDSAEAGEIFGKDIEQPQLAYVQFKKNPDAEEKGRLAQVGMELLSSVGGKTWVVRGKPNELLPLLRLDTIQGFAKLDPRDKLQPMLFHGEIPSYSKTESGNIKLRVLLNAKPKINTDLVASGKSLNNTINALGGKIIGISPSSLGERVNLELPTGKLAGLIRLASEELVRYVETAAPPVRPSALDVAIQSNVDDVRDDGPTLEGEKFSVAVREIGQADTHSDYSSRFTARDNDGATDGSSVNHATAVVGMVAASGEAQPAAKGIAPKVDVLFYTVTDGGASDGFLKTDDIVDAAGNGARISNHSYGPVIGNSAGNAALFGAYTSDSATWDQEINKGDLIVVFACGNERGDNDGTIVGGELYDNIDFLSGSKNTIDVGAVGEAAKAEDDNPETAATSELTSFSSYGPMDDGRVKPDIVAGGVNVSLVQGSSGLQTVTGTSFAAPAVAGMLVLLTERYSEKIGGQPTASLAKNLMLTTASDLEATGPDAKTGYGIANLEKAINLIDQRTSATDSPFFLGEVSEGGDVSFSLTTTAADTEVKVGLCWIDPQGDPAAAKALINDLDLELQSPLGIIHYPFSLSASSPDAAATNSVANVTDPYEQVLLASPEVGTWTIRIKGTTVPQGPQSFALVISKPASAAIASGISASPAFGPAALEVNFSGSLSSGPITKYEWDFGDGSTGADLNVAHTYASPGVYTVRLTVTAGSGDTATSASTITVTKREVDGFGSKIRGRLNFIKFNADTLQLVMVVDELIMASEAARKALKDGDFEGKTYALRIAGGAVKTFILDRKASFKDSTSRLKLNLRKGEIKMIFRKSDFFLLFDSLGITDDPATSGEYTLPVEIETEDAKFNADFKFDYLNKNGKTGIIKTPRVKK